MEVGSHEKHENHFVFAFKPQFSPMYVLAHLNSYFKPIDCFFAVFFDEIEDILIGYISVNRSKDSNFDHGLQEIQLTKLLALLVVVV